MVTAVEDEYLERTPKSAAFHERALAVMPGGDTRTIAHHEPYPLTFERGEGADLVDVDGNRYTDLLLNYTSLVHGHAFGPVVEAVQRQIALGSAWPARNEPQVALAEVLVDRIASVERVRFTNSGTEATTSALRLARIVTGRPKILMARLGYHGSADETEVGTEGHSGPFTHIAPYGDASAFARVLADHGDEIAAVILEPVLGAGGVLPAPPGFLAAVRDAAHAAGALFVLDEVITFRLAAGGAQTLHGVDPDLTAFGKIIGGGLPVGAFGGRAEVMDHLDPRRGEAAHSGTFNGNPVTCAAGLAALDALSPHLIATMNRLGDALTDGLRAAVEAEGLAATVRNAGSLVGCFLHDDELARRFHLAALNRGVFFAPRGMFCLSTLATDASVSAVLDRLADALWAAAAERSVSARGS
jgi:glutamate-1-semialdehyde 2,1-aminomutase